MNNQKKFGGIMVIVGIFLVIFFLMAMFSGSIGVLAMVDFLPILFVTGLYLIMSGVLMRVEINLQKKPMPLWIALLSPLVVIALLAIYHNSLLAGARL